MSSCSAVFDYVRYDQNARDGGTNLIIHHGITNILGQTGQRVGILDVVEESYDFALLFQHLEIFEGRLQFAENGLSVSNGGLGK